MFQAIEDTVEENKDSSNHKVNRISHDIRELEIKVIDDEKKLNLTNEKNVSVDSEKSITQEEEKVEKEEKNLI